MQELKNKAVPGVAKRGMPYGAVFALLLWMLPFSARANMVVNGSFEAAASFSGGPFDGLTCPGGILTPCVTIPGWTTVSDLSILLSNGASATTYLDGGSGITASDGINFIGTDGSCCTLGPISQTLTGLTPGQSYLLTFDQAAAQLSGNFGATTEQFIVSIGGAVGGSPTTVLLSDGVTPYNPAYVVAGYDDEWRSSVISNASGGFSGWISQSFAFTANASSELLAFLAVGTPIGAPPMVLLDNVSVVESKAPEPRAFVLAIGGAGFVSVAVARRRRRKQEV